MGNRSSRIDSKGINNTSAVNSNIDEAVDDVPITGVFLTKNLQNELVQSFQSKVMNELWEERLSETIQRSNERMEDDRRRRESLDTMVKKHRLMNAKIHNSLDSDVDSLRAKFADSVVEFRFDAGSIEGRLGPGPMTGGAVENIKGVPPCSEERIDLTRCQKGGAYNCDGFIQLLERCATSTVIG